MNLSPLPIQKFFDNNGKPLVNGLLFTYVAGLATKQPTYQDSSGTLNSNPIQLDFRGECRLWIDPTLSYKFVLAPAGDTDPPTKAIWTVDNITAGPAQQDNTAVDTGSANNITLAIPQITSPTAFTRIVFKAANTNTGPVVISINGGTAKSLTWQNTAALAGGEIQANGIYETIYDGTRWQLQGPTLDPTQIRSLAEITAGVTPTNYAYSSDPVDPRRYGADPTGVADSTTAVQAAINVAMQGVGGSVYIGNNCNFKCGALTVTFTGNRFTNGLRIFGACVNGSKLTVTGSPATFLTFTGQTPTGAPQEAPLVIENITINASGKTSDGILIQGMAFWTLRRVYMSGCNRSVYLNSALSGKIDDCLIYSGNYGIYAREDGAGSGNHLVKIRDSFISAHSIWGIDFGAGDRFKVESTDFEANGASTAFTFTSGFSGGAISGTLTATWALPTAKYPVYFSDGEVRMVTLTNGATTATWTTGLTGAVTANATAKTGAIVLRDTVNFQAGISNIDFDGLWMEGNVGQTIAVESTTNLTLTIRNIEFYSDSNTVYIEGCSYLSIEDCLAEGVGQTFNIKATFSFLKNLTIYNLTDNSTWPTWHNITTSLGNFVAGRPDSFTATLTGCTTSPTASISVVQQGTNCTLIVPAAGFTAISNTTACTFTGLPSKYQPVTTKQFAAVLALDNSAAAVMGIEIDPGSGTVTLVRTFSNVNTKGFLEGPLPTYKLAPS